MFEIAGVPRDIALRALKLGMYKLPVKSKVIEREVK
jgi:ribosomal protein L16/L10AE